MRQDWLGTRVRAWLPMGAVFGVLGGWVAACGPEGAEPERVRTKGEKLEAYCKAQVNGVGTLDVESDYLPHVVHCENGGAPYESLKAQAVAARTFLYYKLETAGSIGDGQGDQVYSCGSGPTQQQVQAVKDTSGQFLSFQGVVLCSFYVAGSKQTPPACKGNSDTTTEKYVTYNWGLSGDNIHQSTLGWVSLSNKRNRGCMSQWGSRCLANDGWVYGDILKFYYGMDIKLETATGSCVVQQNQPPKGYVDAADCSSIRGWAQDPDAPEKVIDVQVSFGAPAGDPAAITVIVPAGLERSDLCSALGSCNHAFELQTPLSLQDSAGHQVYVTALDSEGGPSAALTGSPATFTCAPPVPPVGPAQGIRRHVPSMEVFNAWQFSALYDVAHLPDTVLEAYPLGPEVPAAPSLAKADDASPEVWLLDLGGRRHVPGPAVMAAWRFDEAEIKTMGASQLSALSKQAPVRPAPFLMQASGPAVYLLDDPGSDGGSGEDAAAGQDASGADGAAGATGKDGGALSSWNRTQDEGCTCSSTRGARAGGWGLPMAAALLVEGLRRFSRRRRLSWC